MNNWHILIVEDEPDGQVVVSTMLDYFNVTTDVVDTAEEALRFLEQSQYTAVVIDLALPGMDGIDLISAIRDTAEIADIPCIAITAYHTTAVKQQALEAGFDAYLAKPLDDTSFVRELDRITSRN